MDDLRGRLANRVQLTTDGHKAYLEAVEGAFGGDVGDAQLIKIYGDAPETEARYSPRRASEPVSVGSPENPSVPRSARPMSSSTT